MVTVKKKMKNSIIFLWTNIEELYITASCRIEFKGWPARNAP